MLHFRFPAALCACAAIFMLLAAHANAYDDLQSMRTAFNAATSWHAVEKMPDGRTVTVDYAAPDRWRIVNPAMTELVIGDQLYMVHGGKSTAMPSFMGGMVRKTVDAFRFGPYPDDVKTSAHDLGMRPLNGTMLHAYSYTSNGTPVTMYVGSNHLPVQSVVQTKSGTMTITYSAWNTPITIAQ